MSQTEFNDPLWRQGISGAQMLFVAFGALVLMPLITGMDPNVALFTAEMADWPGPDPSEHRQWLAEWAADNRLAQEQVIEQLREEGPLPARELTLYLTQARRLSNADNPATKHNDTHMKVSGMNRDRAAGQKGRAGLDRARARSLLEF